MQKFLSLAIRNVFRNKRRTLMTLLVVSGGVAGLLLTGGVFAFMFRGLREQTIRNRLGHLQINNANTFRRDETRALKAFEVNSIDFLLKPVDQEQLARALRKLERLRSAGKPKWMRQPEMQALLHELAASLRPSPQDYPERIASRVGGRTHLVELSAVTHFFARDKLTYAVAAGATPVWTRALRSSSGGWTRSASSASIGRFC